jgi:hypothetical protein
MAGSDGEVGSVPRTREVSRRFVTRRHVAALVVAVFLLAGGSVFVVRTRDDFRAARRGLARSEQRLDRLDSQYRDAVAAHTAELAALERTRDTLRADTNARDQLVATSGVEYRLLTEALQSLSRHRAELAAGTAHAKLLDDCLGGASQVLNEAAVGDVEHLASTLPDVQRLCSRAAA